MCEHFSIMQMEQFQSEFSCFTKTYEGESRLPQNMWADHTRTSSFSCLSQNKNMLALVVIWRRPTWLVKCPCLLHFHEDGLRQAIMAFAKIRNCPRHSYCWGFDFELWLITRSHNWPCIKRMCMNRVLKWWSERILGSSGFDLLQ